MKIPDKLKIGGRDIPIRRKPSSDMNGNFGEYSSWGEWINIATDEDIGFHQHGVSLLHEIIECLNDKHEYKMAHPVIMGLAENLYQVFRDNDLDFGEGKKSK